LHSHIRPVHPPQGDETRQEPAFPAILAANLHCVSIGRVRLSGASHIDQLWPQPVELLGGVRRRHQRESQGDGNQQPLHIAAPMTSRSN
jgi:hypothetical protein